VQAERPSTTRAVENHPRKGEVLADSEHLRYADVETILGRSGDALGPRRPSQAGSRTNRRGLPPSCPAHLSVVPLTDLPHGTGRIDTARHHAGSAVRAQRVVLRDPAGDHHPGLDSSCIVPLKRSAWGSAGRALLDESLAHATLGEESASEAAMDVLPLFERRSCARGVRSASSSLASLRPAEGPRYGASRTGRL
jgi:hypothetical protein